MSDAKATTETMNEELNTPVEGEVSETPTEVIEAAGETPTEATA